MGILAWIVFGLAAGAVARLVTPGKAPAGLFGTLAVGIAGALIGGIVGEVVFGEEVQFGFDLGPFLVSVAGAVALLLALQALAKRR
jgi:uncharacterized membrane protein YeaQ/YmgE (transglycosylase-associated protein family)